MPTAGNSGSGSAAPSALLRTLVYSLEIAIIAVLYIGFASTAQLFPAIAAAQTPLWPPTGLALAIILLRGYRGWPRAKPFAASGNLTAWLTRDDDCDRAAVTRKHLCTTKCRHEAATTLPRLGLTIATVRVIGIPTSIGAALIGVRGQPDAGRVARGSGGVLP